MRSAVTAIVLMRAGFAFAQSVDEHGLAYRKFEEGGGTAVLDSSLYLWQPRHHREYGVDARQARHGVVYIDGIRVTR